MHYKSIVNWSLNRIQTHSLTGHNFLKFKKYFGSWGAGNSQSGICYVDSNICKNNSEFQFYFLFLFFTFKKKSHYRSIFCFDFRKRTIDNEFIQHDGPLYDLECLINSNMKNKIEEKKWWFLIVILIVQLQPNFEINEQYEY